MRVYLVGGLRGVLPEQWVRDEQTILQIYEGNSDRQWLEAEYVVDYVKPIGKVKVIIPEGPDHPNALLDACIAFYPKYFESCPSLLPVQSKLKRATRLDFHLGQDKIPTEWKKLREEARELFRLLPIYEVITNQINGPSRW